MRVAAVADIHLGVESAGSLRPALEHLPDHADVLLLGGDLTRHGTLEEARVVAAEFADLPYPIVVVLGNHDYHSDAERGIEALLADHGMHVLECDSVTLPIGDLTLGIAAAKGFGGGFAGKCASAFGERQMKQFAGHTEDIAERFRDALEHLDADVRIALTHYAPVKDTLRGEPPEIFPFLGSYLLGEPIDETGVDLAIHGHAHAGIERGATPGGIPVRNVAQPVIRQAYAVYNVAPAAVPQET